MKIEFLPTKTDFQTVKVDSYLLHSAYNPIKEAERIASTLQIPETSKKIIISEPGLCYLIPFLKEKYKCPIGIVRYCRDFEKYNNADFIINFESPENLKSQIYKFINKEELFDTFFYNYEPSAKAFPEKNKLFWNTLKQILEEEKTLLVTSEYFEQKWLHNTIKFCTTVNYTTRLNKKIDKDILICASGPSLNNIIKTIKKYKDRFFIICLSSALTPLLSNNISPDLVFSTDGGYWAGEHLKKLSTNSIPLALPVEAYCKTKILHKNIILPLIYEDGISKKLHDYCNLNYDIAQRNGTVSGTALNFALKNSNGKIYFSGLDLSAGKGYQHTQPNELEINNSLKDNKIKPAEKRITPAQFNSNSLLIYENWFKSQNFESRVYRIIDNKKNSLGSIKDITSTEFENIAKTQKVISNNQYFDNSYSISKEEKIRKIENCKKYIEKYSNSDEWKKSLFPLSYISLNHNKEIIEKIENKNNKLVYKLWKLLDE